MIKHRLQTGVFASAFTVFAATLPISPVLSAQSAQLVAQLDPARPPVRTVTQEPSARVSVTFERASLAAALRQLAQLGNVRINYTSEMVARAKPVNVTLSRTTVQDGLARVLAGSGLRAVPVSPTEWTITESADPQTAAQGVIVGRVVNAKTKQPVAGATITLSNGSRSVTTNDEGEFRIPVAAGEHTIHVRAVGMIRQVQKVTVSENGTTIVTVAMEGNASVLDEVVVTGTVVATERRAIATPITVITADDIERRGITRLEELLRGEVPGVIAIEKGTQMYEDTPDAMAASDIYVRGPTNVTTDRKTSPLKTYIDGVELVDPSYLGTIDPSSIEKIEIITGPQAATIYGSGAFGGVMQIFTKKGTGSRSPDFRLNLRYGMLENSGSAGRTPSHNHTLQMTGGNGPAFTYSGNLSYVYTGQWQPALFNRSMGASVGAMHTRGPVTVRGNVSVTGRRNGVGTSSGISPYYYQGMTSGILDNEMLNNVPALQVQRLSESAAQTLSLNADYRISPSWTHSMTVGRNQVDLTGIPEAPQYQFSGDSVFRSRKNTSEALTLGYNSTIIVPEVGPFRATVTLGANGSRRSSLNLSGCTAPSASATTLSNCSVSKGTGETTGGFGSFRLSVFNQLHINAGLRGEKTPAYGRDHKIDWTPTHGVTYTLEFGDLSLKLLGSYGRTTRTPEPEWRDEIVTVRVIQYISQFENTDLTPEYSRGPQGGLELYYGNLGSFTVNRYRQKITDLIQHLLIDSVEFEDRGRPTFLPQYRYQNVGSLLQQGWEFTATANIMRLALQGTYSLSDTKELYVNPEAIDYIQGGLMRGIPTRMANVIATYAYGGTTISLATSYSGPSEQNGGVPAQLNYAFARLKMYRLRGRAFPNGVWMRPGYAKSNLSVLHNVTPWLTATLNITNIGNSYGSNVQPIYPTLGRQTLFGVALRSPNNNR